MFDVCEVDVCTTDLEWLRTAIWHLLRTGLIARGHIVQVQTIDLLDGELREEVRYRATLHTRRGNVTTIVDFIDRDPTGRSCSVVALPITDGHPSYLQWVRTKTKTPQ